MMHCCPMRFPCFPTMSGDNNNFKQFWWFHLDLMSFTWKELQYFLLCRRQRRVWFHSAGKAKLNPGNKKQSYAVEVNLSTHFKAKSPNPRKADIIWFKDESNWDFYRLTFTSSPLCQTNGLKAFSTEYNFHPFRIWSVWITFSQFGQCHPQSLYFFNTIPKDSPSLPTDWGYACICDTIWQHYGTHQRVWHVERHDTLSLKDKLSMWL